MTRFLAIGLFVSIVGMAAYGGIKSGLERQNPNNLLFGGFMLFGLAALAWEMRGKT